MRSNIEKWDYFELILEAEVAGNPFVDVDFSTTFSLGHRRILVDGFYDGDSRFLARFMPDIEGEWQYETSSNVSELDGVRGSFTCGAPAEGNHGPVRVIDPYHFAYEDGTAYHPVGTTCYVWNLQGDALEEETLETLASAPFNKMRMCVFPKRYSYNNNEPPLYPFEGEPTHTWDPAQLGNRFYTDIPDCWDFTQFNPAYFQHLEKRILQLRAMNIEADLIIFHPYDCGAWGFDKMPAEVNDRYLRYLVARVAAFRNVWWSFANEFDFLTDHSLADWDRYFKIVQQHDPYDHLRSNHNGRYFYDHGKPWVTHCSIQRHDMTQIPRWLKEYGKPVIIDECGYEGDIGRAYGSFTAEELVARHWQGFATGGYVGHGECFEHDEDVLWWAKGGQLYGDSPARLAFLREIFEAVPAPGLFPMSTNRAVRSMLIDRPYNGITVGHNSEDFLLIYYWMHQLKFARLNLPEDKRYRIDIIDTWNMTITEAEAAAAGTVQVQLPRRKYVALRAQRVS